MLEVQQNNTPGACLSVGLDVGADFTWMSIVAPSAVPVGKPFKILHNNPDSREAAVRRIKDAQEQYSLTAHCFAESTGIYHLPLLYYLRNEGLECHLINPIITKNSANLNVRKVHNDKFDSQKIAQIGLNATLKTSLEASNEVRDLRNLVRDYYDYADQRTVNVLQLSAVLKESFPGYADCFTSVTCSTSIALLKKWPTPAAFHSACKSAVLKVLRSAKRGETWAKKKYEELQTAASEALKFGVQSASDDLRIQSTVETIEHLGAMKKRIEDKLRAIIDADSKSELAKAVALLETIPGAGFITAVTLVAEMGDLSAFSSARKLAAFWGLDPAVHQSGHSQTESCRMSKRGSPYARRALHTLALQSVRTMDSSPQNPVLREYYDNKCKSKPKLVAQGAVMHKLCFIIFAVLRDRKKFKLRTPAEHAALFAQRDGRAVTPPV